VPALNAGHDEEEEDMAVTGILGKKIGMTQIFDDNGTVHPITVLKVGPCVITQLKTQKKDGYDAAQIGLVEFVKASKVNKAMTGHFAKFDVPPAMTPTKARRPATASPSRSSRTHASSMSSATRKAVALLA
jgi:large subunit ribosomal protein L3